MTELTMPERKVGRRPGPPRSRAACHSHHEPIPRSLDGIPDRLILLPNLNVEVSMSLLLLLFASLTLPLLIGRGRRLALASSVLIITIAAAIPDFKRA